MGLHSASDGGGDPGEEEEETTGQGPPHTGEEPIQRLPAGQDFQRRQVRVTIDWSWGQRLRRSPSVTKGAELNTANGDGIVVNEVAVDFDCQFLTNFWLWGSLGETQSDCVDPLNLSEFTVAGV